MPSYDNKVVKGERLAQFWNEIATKIKGWISPKQDHQLSGTNDASKVLVTDASKNIVTSSVSTTSLGYLDATSSIQTQLNGKHPAISVDGGGAGSFTNIIGGDNVTLSNATNGLTINSSCPLATQSTIGGFIADSVSTGSALGAYTFGATTICGEQSSSYHKIGIKTATTSTSGLMTTTMVTKLNGIEAGANNYTLPYATDSSLGGVYVMGGNSPTSGVNYFDGFVAEGGHLTIPVADPYGPGDNAVAGVISATDIRLLYSRAPIASPTFTGHPECASTPTANAHLTNKSYVDSAISSAISGSTQFQGSVTYPDTDTTHSELCQHGDFKAGQYWLVNVSTAQTIAGQVCEAGDLVYCIETHSHTAGTAITASKFSVVQNNVDFLTESEITAIVALVS